MRRTLPFVLVGVLTLLATSGGAILDDPAGPEAWKPRIPVVLVPGMTGTELRERDSGRVVWGSGGNLLRPADGGYELARGLEEPPHASPLEPGELIRKLQLFGVVRKQIYGPVIHALGRSGWTLGDIENPSTDDDLYLFAYDWRQDNLFTARRLSEALERIRRARGVERLDVALVCQSNGAAVCRYVARYGGLRLEQAETGSAVAPAAVRIAKLVLIGGSNGGALRVLRLLNRGRRYVPGIGRKFHPEVFFTFPSLFQDLPGCDTDLFIDAEGNAVDLDLYDAETWAENGWSIFSPEARARAEKSGRFGSVEKRKAYLARTLDHARRLQRLLARNSAGFRGTRYYMVRNASHPTTRRAVLNGGRDGPRLLFAGDRRVERSPMLKARVVEAGDGHATETSQLCLAPQETAALHRPPLMVRGKHFDMILEPASQRFLVEALED